MLHFFDRLLRRRAADILSTRTLNRCITAFVAFLLASMVGLYVWHLSDERAEIIDETMKDLRYAAASYGQYAATLTQLGIDARELVVATDRDDPATLSSRGQVLLERFRRQFMSPRGDISLRLLPFTGWSPGETVPEAEQARLVATAPFPAEGFLSVAEVTEADIFSWWQEVFEVQAVTQLGLTGSIAVLGFLLMRQLQRRERMETARRELQEQLYQSQKMQALGTLAGGIAHDLNNTLVPVLAIPRILMKDAPEGTPFRRNLDLIYQAGVRARDLVTQILAFGRRSAAEPRPTLLEQPLADALAILRPGIPATISIETETEAAPAVLGDPTQLRQVIVNLVTNAAQAIGADLGRITIRIAPGRGGREARLIVEDTGCGMSKETLHRIYEPFFTTKEVGSGTGLGLAVVYSIVTGNGGTIVAESEVGKGTRFTLTFPAMSTERRGHLVAA